MNHPAKPAPLAPLERRDEPVWLALLAACDDRCRIEMRSGEAAGVLLLQGVPMQPADADAALDRIESTGRIERDPGGLRVCVERVVGQSSLYGAIVRSEIWSHGSPALRALWLQLLVTCDGDGRIALQLPELAREAGIDVADAEAALEWLVGTERVERMPDSTLRLRTFKRYAPIHPRPPAAPNEDTPHGSTQKGTRIEGTQE